MNNPIPINEDEICDLLDSHLLEDAESLCVCQIIETFTGCSIGTVPESLIELLLGLAVRGRIRSSCRELLISRDLKYCVDHEKLGWVASHIVDEFDEELRKLSFDQVDPSSSVIAKYAAKLTPELNSERVHVLHEILSRHFETFSFPQKFYKTALSDSAELVNQFFDSKKGNQVGDYVRTEFLGSGGLGEVWKAKNVENEQVVALKTPKQGRFKDGESLNHWIRRAERNMNVRHPNIVSIHEVGKHNPYVVMEYVDWQTLDEFLNSRPNPEQSSWPTLVQIVEAIERLADACFRGFHQSGLIPLDIKTSNIFAHCDVDSFTLKLFDFEETELLNEVRNNGPGSSPKTTPFLSWEVRNSSIPSPNISSRATVSQLAGILFTLVTGNRLYIPKFDKDDSEASISVETIGANAFEWFRGDISEAHDGLSLGKIYYDATKSDWESRPDIAEFQNSLHAWLRSSINVAAPNQIKVFPTPLLADKFFNRKQLDPAIEKLAAKVGSPILLQGPSGVGKSTLATRIAETALSQGIVENVFWLDGTSTNTLLASFENLARCLRTTFSVSVNWNNALELFTSDQFGRNLLLVDNLMDDSAFNKFVAPYLSHREVDCIITSYRLVPDVMIDEDDVIRVGDLESEEEGARFLCHRAGLEFHSLGVNDLELANEIARLVERRILPLDQLGAYLQKKRKLRNRWTLQNLANEYSDSQQASKLRLDRVATKHGHPASYSTTIIYCFKGLSKPCRRLLLFCAQFEPEPIPRELFLVGEQIDGDLTPVAASWSQFDDLVDGAVLASLLTVTDDQSLLLHLAVRDVLQDLCTREEFAKDLEFDNRQLNFDARVATGRLLLNGNALPIETSQLQHLWKRYETDLPESVFEVPLYRSAFFRFGTATLAQLQQIVDGMMLASQTVATTNPLFSAFSLIESKRLESTLPQNSAGSETFNLLPNAAPHAELMDHCFALLKDAIPNLNSESVMAFISCINKLNGVFPGSEMRTLELVELAMHLDLSEKANFYFEFHRSFHVDSPESSCEIMEKYSSQLGEFGLNLDSLVLQDPSLRKLFCQKKNGESALRRSTSCLLQMIDEIESNGSEQYGELRTELLEYLKQVPRLRKKELYIETGILRDCFLMFSTRVFGDKDGSIHSLTLEVWQEISLVYFDLLLYIAPTDVAEHQQSIAAAIPLLFADKLKPVLPFTIRLRQLIKIIDVHANPEKKRQFKDAQYRFGMTYLSMLDKILEHQISRLKDNPYEPCSCGSSKSFKYCERENGKNHLRRIWNEQREKPV